MPLTDAQRARGVIEKHRCPHCGKRVALTKGGALRSHTDKREQAPRPRCGGSGQVVFA